MNRKKIILSVVLVSMVKLLSAQILIALLFGDKLNSEKLAFGLDVGLNRSSITNLEPSSANLGLKLGLTFVYKMNDKLQLNPSLYYSFPMGAKGIVVYETPDTNLNAVLKKATIKRQLSYLSLPILLRYKIIDYGHIELGPQINYLSKATDIFTASLYNDNDIVYNANIISKYKRIDAGAAIGFAYALKKGEGVTLNVHYYYGLVDISKDTKEPNQHNSVFNFGVAIPVGASD